MSEALMLVDHVMAELQAITQLQNRVKGSLELSTLTKDGVLPQSPEAAFVISLGMDARASDRATGVHSQLVTERVGVMLVVQAVDDPSGTRSRVKVENLAEDVINTVSGTTVAATGHVVDFVKARLADMRGGSAFYQIDFSSSRHLRKLS
jgi:hypothetical protein